MAVLPSPAPSALRPTRSAKSSLRSPSVAPGPARLCLAELLLGGLPLALGGPPVRGQPVLATDHCPPGKARATAQKFVRDQRAQSALAKRFPSISSAEPAAAAAPDADSGPSPSVVAVPDDLLCVRPSTPMEVPGEPRPTPSEQAGLAQTAKGHQVGDYSLAALLAARARYANTTFFLTIEDTSRQKATTAWYFLVVQDGLIRPPRIDASRTPRMRMRTCTGGFSRSRSRSRGALTRSRSSSRLRFTSRATIPTTIISPICSSGPIPQRSRRSSSRSPPLRGAAWCTGLPPCPHRGGGGRRLHRLRRVLRLGASGPRRGGVARCRGGSSRPHYLRSGLARPVGAPFGGASFGVRAGAPSPSPARCRSPRPLRRVSVRSRCAMCRSPTTTPAWSTPRCCPWSPLRLRLPSPALSCGLRSSSARSRSSLSRAIPFAYAPIDLQPVSDSIDAPLNLESAVRVRLVSRINALLPSLASAGVTDTHPADIVYGTSEGSGAPRLGPPALRARAPPACRGLFRSPCPARLGRGPSGDIGGGGRALRIHGLARRVAPAWLPRRCSRSLVGDT